MQNSKRNLSDLTIEEAYVIYKVRSDPSLWEILNKYIKPNGTIRSEAEARSLKGDEVVLFKIEK